MSAVLFLLYRKFLKSSEIVYNRLEIKNCRLPRLLTQQGLTTIERVDDAG